MLHKAACVSVGHSAHRLVPPRPHETHHARRQPASVNMALSQLTLASNACCTELPVFLSDILPTAWCRPGPTKRTMLEGSLLV